jgi:hypothetical protein
MELRQFKQYEPIYVIGHANIDIDSAVASKILSDVFKTLNYRDIRIVLTSLSRCLVFTQERDIQVYAAEESCV